MFDWDKALLVAGIIGGGVILRTALGTGAGDGMTSWDWMVGGLWAAAIAVPVVGFGVPLWRRLSKAARPGSDRA